MAAMEKKYPRAEVRNRFRPAFQGFCKPFHTGPVLLHLEEYEEKCKGKKNSGKGKAHLGNHGHGFSLSLLRCIIPGL